MIEAMWLNHPQGCMGYRLETKDGVLVYATDNEPGDPLFDKNVRKLAAGADVLIYDAQYLPEEYEARKRGWGHSHWREAINVVTGKRRQRTGAVSPRPGPQRRLHRQSRRGSP